MRALYLALYFGTCALLFVGAQLQVLKTALVCPDWPLCYGEFLPQTMSPAFYESLHRFLAMVLALGSMGWGIVRYKKIGIKAWLPFFFIVLQSLLGLATFLYRLPTITTVLHLIFSLIYLSSLEGTSEISFDDSLKQNWNPKTKDVVNLFFSLLIIQFILGGILRKSSLLASCESTMEFWSCWRLQSQIPLAGSLSLLHRSLGLLTTLSGLFIFSYLLKVLPKWKIVPAIGLLSMVIQLILGLQMGRSSSREMIIWHFTTALVAFCALLFLIVRLRRYEFHFFGKAVPTFLNDLLDLFKPKLTTLVVVTLLVGVFLAPIRMNIIYLFISLIAIWFQAAGSLALNSYIEREEDKFMERTKDRPLPSGRLDPKIALMTGWTLLISGTVILFFSANALTALLGLVSGLSYLFLYTPMKLRSPYALYVGAVPGALPTVMGWTTVTDSFGGLGIFLFGILFLWQIPHFMAISYYRKEEYGRAKFKTFAQTHSFSFLRLNIFFYSFVLMLFGMIPFYSEDRGDGYLVASLIIGVMLLVFGSVGFIMKDQKKWARLYFWVTLFYLPLQLGVLLVLR